MSIKFVGIGGITITNNPGETIKTIALGSCVGIIVYWPEKRVAGLAHVALPDSSIASDNLNRHPGYFADEAIPNLLKGFQRFGLINQSDLIIKLAGGANVMDTENHFNIGKRNILTIRKILWRYRLGPVAEDVGKNFSRTVWIEVCTGKVYVSSPGRGQWEL